MVAGTQSKPIAPPSDDKRWRIVAATMRRYGYSPDSLIETLHTVQESFGYIDEDAMRFVAASLGVSHSRVYGVATFYNFFSLKPQGKHTCVVCLGTACYIKGGPALIQAVEQVAGIHPDETTPDKQVSLMVARCIGACGLAPAAVFDGDVAGKMAPAEAAAKIREWMNHAD
jgi:bidirectional [NiFe] hydrogenase diaphorase subunit